MPAPQHKGHGGLFHSRNQFRNGKPRFNIAAHGIDEDQQPVNFRTLLNGGDLRDHMLIFRGLGGFRQHLMPLDLPDDGQTVDAGVPAFQLRTAKLYGFLPLLL